MPPKRAESSNGAPAASPSTGEQSGLAGGTVSWQKLLEFLARDGSNPEEAYRRMREQLIKFFAWRGSHNGDDLADETLTRVALKLTRDDVQAERPAAFVIGVARMIDLECKRREGRWVAFTDGVAANDPPPPGEGKEQLLAALRRCLQELSAADRRLLLRYHEPRGEQRAAIRQAIADELNAALGALRVRMHRMRLQVEACVERRLAAASGNVGA
jgi:DNA-directed RNA polymerase specialized sigma24 family protein